MQRLYRICLFFTVFAVSIFFFIPSSFAATPTPTPTLTMLQRCDINGDGVIDSIDFGILSNSWHLTRAQLTYPRADINQDGYVDLLDVSWFATYFGQL